VTSSAVVKAPNTLSGRDRLYAFEVSPCVWSNGGETAMSVETGKWPYETESEADLLLTRDNIKVN
jgi:hypothetical protein